MSKMDKVPHFKELIEEISQKVNCKECDPRLCNNNYLNCIKIKEKQIKQKKTIMDYI